MRLRKAEIPVERVDENLECLLHRVEMPALRVVCRGFDVGFGLQPELAQVAEQRQEQIQLVAARFDVERQHQRRIQRLHVAMPHVANDALVKHVRVTAGKWTRFAELRDGVALVQVFAQEERIDLRRVTAHDNVLIVVGKDLGLDEVARAEQVADSSHGLRAGFLDAECSATSGSRIPPVRAKTRHRTRSAEMCLRRGARGFRISGTGLCARRFARAIARAESRVVTSQFQWNAGDGGAG